MTRSYLLPLLALICAWLSAPAAQGDPPSDVEYWMGAMETNSPANPSLEFMVTFRREGDGWRATLDIPPSVGIGGAWGIEFLNAQLSPESIELVQPPSIPNAAPNLFVMAREPSGSDTAVGRVLIGGAAEIKARMWRVSPEIARDFMPRRPQLPRAPFPYVQTRVDVPNTRGGETVGVQGVLTLPPGPGPHPAVVLVNALDVHDADHSSMGHKPFLVLADRLARAGIASLRTADRPLSKPGFAARTQVTIEQLGMEAAERVAWLAKQDGIDGRRIGIVGLNEGGTAAAIAAAQPNSAAVCLVMLAPLAVTGLQQLRDEFSTAILAEGESADFVNRRTESFMRQYELLAAGASREEVTEAIRAEMTMQRAARRQQLGEASDEVVAGLADQQFRIINAEEFRRGLGFDPTDWFVRIAQPALVCLGGKDTRFTAKTNAPAIETSLAARAGVETIVRTWANLNHRLQPAVSGSMSEIQEIEVTMDEGVLKEVVDFLSRHLGSGGAKKEDKR